METYTFTLILKGPDTLLSENFERLEDSGCDDASFGERGGVQYADFDREARTYVDAVVSAIANVENAVVGLSVLRVESETLVGVSDVAERTGLSREYVRLLADGQRGPKNFPSPRASIGGNRVLWDWPEVADWFRNALGKPVDMEPHAAATRAINAILEYRRASARVDTVEQFSLTRWSIRHLFPLQWTAREPDAQSALAILKRASGPPETNLQQALRQVPLEPAEWGRAFSRGVLREAVRQWVQCPTDVASTDQGIYKAFIHSMGSSQEQQQYKSIPNATEWPLLFGNLQSQTNLGITQLPTTALQEDRLPNRRIPMQIFNT
jgi:predicted DNA-binding transcriptional regulator AlpA